MIDSNNMLLIMLFWVYFFLEFLNLLIQDGFVEGVYVFIFCDGYCNCNFFDNYFDYWFIINKNQRCSEV